LQILTSSRFAVLAEVLRDFLDRFFFVRIQLL